MKRKLRITCFAMIFVLGISVTSVYAIADSIKFQLYVAEPYTMKVAVEESKSIKAVEKFTFNYKGKETFSNFKKLMNSIDGSMILPLSVRWVSSNEKIAAVNSYGRVSGVKKGTAYIYPLPKGVYSYKIKGKYITYIGGNMLGEIKIYGGIGIKVRVTR